MKVELKTRRRWIFNTQIEFIQWVLFTFTLGTLIGWWISEKTKNPDPGQAPEEETLPHPRHVKGPGIPV